MRGAIPEQVARTGWRRLAASLGIVPGSMGHPWEFVRIHPEGPDVLYSAVCQAGDLAQTQQSAIGGHQRQAKHLRRSSQKASGSCRSSSVARWPGVRPKVPYVATSGRPEPARVVPSAAMARLPVSTTAAIKLGGKPWRRPPNRIRKHVAILACDNQ
jgi:hypothetical protein